MKFTDKKAILVGFSKAAVLIFAIASGALLSGCNKGGNDGSSDSANGARTIEAIKKAGVIKIGTEGSYPPFSYFENNKLVGFEVDIGDAIAAKMGVKAEWTSQAFDSLLIALNQDRFQLVIASHGITPEREQAIDFSNPHYCSGGMIGTKKGGPKTVAELKGKVVGVQVGSTYYKEIQKIEGLKSIQTYPTSTDCYQNLVAGKIDAWVTDKFSILEAIKSHPEQNLEKGEVVFTERVAMAVSKGNSTLKEAVNTALAEIQKDGTYEKISKKYFGEDVRCAP
jgi:polar amino acid transport system substrate-binding protein